MDRVYGRDMTVDALCKWTGHWHAAFLNAIWAEKALVNFTDQKAGSLFKFVMLEISLEQSRSQRKWWPIRDTTTNRSPLAYSLVSATGRPRRDIRQIQLTYIPSRLVLRDPVRNTLWIL
jgi:hypothetical protein